MILYQKELENGKANTLSRKTNYFKKKKQVKYLILKTNTDSTLIYNHIVLVAMLGASRVHWSHNLSWLVPLSAIVYRGRVSTLLTSAHRTYLNC